MAAAARSGLTRLALLLAALSAMGACGADGGTAPSATAAMEAEPTPTTAPDAASATTNETVPALDERAVLAVWEDTPAPASSCVLVRRGDRVVLERNPDVPLVPASAVKLVVADAALAELAEDAGTHQLVTAALRESDNDAARSLADEVGLDEIVPSLARRGLPTAGLTIRDATGHDRGNRVTCRLLAALLVEADRAVRDALPVAATSGTLAHRMVGTPAAGRVAAKTGSISGVTALAGYADRRDGEVVFAHVLNGVGSRAEGEALHDRLAVALVGSP